ncbi:hypothetical protein RclHR1_00690015 [Rhizophagus clarus]|uniref:Secreted peptidase family S41 n=1 Tax=Rhizophagus clarus TaxID=94130 RepID=A0A2Z6S6S2_9GLOM|nr:hypothetical protein RclHR1_00690015 [Rhizophagus clarus]GES83695.1 secreted peptidase family S41 [Rhizophagus clarus]
MKSTLNNFYILIFALIALLVIPCDSADDACARLANDYKQSNGDPNFSLKHSDVQACFESFPYDKNLAKNTIETLKRSLQGFYVFLSQAKEPPQQGFSFRAMDLIKELDSLLSNNYKTDYQFMMDTFNLINDLKDPHLGFMQSCYFTFSYDQQLSLYSVVNNNEQIIKIFEDKKDKNTIDCEVTHIDGKPSIEVIKEYADTLPLSRDSGARFNYALSRVIFDDNGDLVETPGSFTSRRNLPNNSSVEYSLKCANDASKNFTREWKVTPKTPIMFNMFNTSKDYWDTFCLINDNITVPSSNATNVKAVTQKIYNVTEAKMVYKTSISEFFILSDKKTGVFVLSSVSAPDFVDELFEIQNGFNLLENSGIKKLVLDFSDNIGGSIELGFFIVYLLFPGSDPSFNQDMVVTEISREAFFQATAQSELKHYIDISKIPPFNISSNESIARWAADAAYDVTSGDSDFDAFSYKNPATHEHFHNAKEFIGNNANIRGGTPTKYTTKFVNRYSERLGTFIELVSGNFFNKYEWKNKDMIILTNGLCGSACASISQRMAIKHNVSTVAIGGYKDTQLSYASFPGGQIIKFDDFLEDLDGIGLLQNKTLVDLIPLPFEINAKFSFTLREAYDVVNKYDLNQEDVLEFIFKPAEYRIYYDEITARDPSVLWLKVAKLLN